MWYNRKCGHPRDPAPELNFERGKMTKRALLAVFVATPLMSLAQSITTVPADLVDAKSVDYSTAKPLIMSKEGVYVCRDGYSMYINVPAPKIPVKDDKTEHSNLYKLGDGAKVFSTDAQKYLPICVAIK